MILVVNPTLFPLFFEIENWHQLEEYCSHFRAIMRHVAGQSSAKHFVEPDLVVKLTESGQFPFGDVVKEKLEKYDKEGVFSATDINRLLSKFLYDAECLLQLSQLDIVDGRLVICTPLKNGHNWYGLEESVANTLCLLGVTIGLKRTKSGCIIFTPGSLFDTGINFSFECAILDSLPALTQQETAQVTKAHELKTFCHKTKPAGLYRAKDLWAMARTKDDLKMSIDSECHSLQPLMQCRKYSIGEHFFDSLEKHQSNGEHNFAAITLRKCSEIVLDSITSRCGPFWTDTTRTKQRKRARDGALAYRAHVSRGTGLRLMYWQLPCGEIELANIGQKNEEKIF